MGFNGLHCLNVRQLTIQILAPFIIVSAYANTRCIDLFNASSKLASVAPTGLELFAQKYDGQTTVASSRPSATQRLKANSFDQSSSLTLPVGDSYWIGPFQNEIQLYYGDRARTDNKVRIQVSQTAFPYQGFIGETFNYEDREFRIVNVGTKQLSEDWPAIERAVNETIQKHPNRNIEVVMPMLWSRGCEILNSWRTQVSQRVTEIYRNRKFYLSGQDTFDLRFSDRVSEQKDDYFVLLKNTDLSVINMTREQVNQNILGSIRLARLTNQTSALPSSIIGQDNSDGSLPFSRRKTFEAADKTISLLNRLHKTRGLKFAEISRFAKVKETPGALMNVLIKKVFEAAQLDVDILVTSVDPHTRRLFKNKYRFQDLTSLEEGGEQLLYLDTRSPEFAQTLKEVTEATESINYRQSSKAALNLEKIDLWGPDKRFYEENGELFENEGERFHKVTLDKARLGDRHLVSVIPSLSNERVMSKQRALEIARWVLSAEGIFTFEQIPPSDLSRVILSHNFEIFMTSVFTAFSSAGGPIPGGKTLIYTEEPQPFHAYLTATSQTLNARILPLASAPSVRERDYDQIIIYDSMYRIHNPEGRNQWEKMILSQLKLNRTLTIIEPLASFQHEKIGDVIINEAMHLIDEKAPLTEYELGYGLALLAQNLRTMPMKPLTNGSIEQAIKGAQLGHLRYSSRIDSSLGLWILHRKAL